MEEVPSLSVEAVPSLQIQIPAEPSFHGFESEAFETLERLRERPIIDQYRIEKESIDRFIKKPFRRYRDDVVVGAVLPNLLRLETERNVFSRLLKNDFGRGGCHHHFWMSFYRPGWTRLKDLQLIHSLHPDAFYVGISASQVSRPVLNRLRRVLEHEADHLNRLLSPLAGDFWSMTIRRGDRIFRAVPEESSNWRTNLSTISALRVMRRFEHDDVVSEPHVFLSNAIHAIAAVWPLYLLLLPSTE